MSEHIATQSSIQRGKTTTVRVTCSCGRYIQTEEFKKTSFKAMCMLLTKICKEGPALEEKVLKDIKAKKEKKAKKQKPTIKDSEATWNEHGDDDFAQPSKED